MQKNVDRIENVVEKYQNAGVIFFLNDSINEGCLTYRFDATVCTLRSGTHEPHVRVR